MRPAPGLLGQVLCRLFFDPDERTEQYEALKAARKAGFDCATLERIVAGYKGTAARSASKTRFCLLSGAVPGPSPFSSVAVAVPIFSGDLMII